MSVIPLYPEAGPARPLKGLYLERDVRPEGWAENGRGPFIYANYIASVDGRISLRDASGFSVPATLANARDWRLYQELAAQADVLIVSGRYVRQLAAGAAQADPPVSTADEYADLLDWRRARGLPAQPDIAIVSASLDIPPEPIRRLADRRVLVLTTARANAARTRDRVRALERAGAQFVPAGEARVEGGKLRERLGEMGYATACMVAGPKVHATLVGAGALDALFLTTRHLLLGGDAGGFHTILEGPAMATRLALESMHLDEIGGQSFARYRVLS